MKNLVLCVFLCLSASIFPQIQLQPRYEAPEANVPLATHRFFSDPLSAGQTYSMKVEIPGSFSCFGIGWLTPHDVPVDVFTFRYRTRLANGAWSYWIDGDADFSPAEIPSGHYRTDAWFTFDATSHDEIELLFPITVDITELRVDLFNGNDSDAPAFEGPVSGTRRDGNRSCPEFPEIIMRSQWCGGSAPCTDVLAGYAPTTINATHVVMHHGASPDTYTDGAAIVRSYWNYHVNTNGWADIGYNYIIDKHGNFYQGRHNPNLPSTDVRGAHAGTGPNNESIGMNFLGNLDVSIATPIQLDKLHQVLGWWFNHKNISVFGSSEMTTQSNGVQVQPHFTHHNAIGSTSCPGTDMISRMPSIRLGIQAVIDVCTADQVPPTTVVQTPYDWRGHDFDAAFVDEDNPDGSGVVEQYVQVLEFDGQEWRANATHGYFNDNFSSAIHPDWIVQSGNWVIDNESVLQDNESTGNTNLYAELTQDASSAYLYQWSMFISGTAGNRRGGLHFFVDDPTLDNRGNSYLAWFRADDNAFQFYRIQNNVLNMVVNNPVTVNVDQWYDCKVSYNPQTGKLQAFLDNQLVGEYTDPNPYQQGEYISIRSGNSLFRMDDLKVRKSRGNQSRVTVGPDEWQQVRHQSLGPSQDACRINSLVKDGGNNWSEPNARHLYIDWIAPSTEVAAPSGSQTTDFSVEFNDTDNENGSGVDRRFYAVHDFNGTEWRANWNRGFYMDDFETTLHEEWDTYTGAWAVENGKLLQSDESENNTNIAVPLNQTLSNRYLYHFDMQIGGTGTNRRAGFHYFCDQPELPNRGNSYFVWFRVDSQTLEFYKVIDDVFTQEKVVPFSLVPEQTYAIDVVYDRITGETFVYVDGKLAGEWQDGDPLTTGSAVSFRSGHSQLTVDNFYVLRTRFPMATVLIGSDGDVRYESQTTATARVRSRVIDLAQNLSNLDEKEVNVYWSPTTAGIQTAPNTALCLYPNPNRGRFTLNFGDYKSNQVSLRLWDAKGASIPFVLVNQNMDGNFAELDAGILASGIYYLHLHTANEHLVIPVSVVAE
jgi:hypothetical protein